MAKFTVSLDENDLAQIIREYISAKLGEGNIELDKVRVLVKSKQNYRSAWEDANIVITNDDKVIADKLPQIMAEVSKEP